MPLDPQAKALLDEFAAAGAPPPWEVPLADLRAGFDELSAALAAPAPEVARVEDRTVPGPDGAIPIRLYWPESDGDGALPVLVHFHGGGFVLLGLDAYDPICKTLCAGAGCIVVGVGYRKAPENKFPEGGRRLLGLRRAGLLRTVPSLSGDAESGSRSRAIPPAVAWLPASPIAPRQQVDRRSSSSS